MSRRDLSARLLRAGRLPLVFESRARVAALVRTLRESLKPRPVMRPVPGGAR